MNNPSMVLPACLLFGAVLLKLPALVRNRQDILLSAVCALLLSAGLVFLLAAVPTIAAVNRVTGVPNFAAPLVYSALTGFSAACLILVVVWRGGVTRRTKRASLLCVIVYGVVIIALNVLFTLGDASVERLRDFDTYYANTPYIREMIVLYLLAHTAAAVVMAVLCRRWSRRVTGVLRAGLLLIVSGYILNLGFDLAKLTAVAARWTGRDWDTLSTDVAPPLAAAAAPLIGGGFVLPLVTQRVAIGWRTLVRHHRLRPLARLLADTAAPGAPEVSIGPWAPLDLRLIQREAAIHDGIIALRPWFDEAVHIAVRDRALAQGHSPERAGILADAAMITAADRARRNDPGRTGLADEGARAQPSTRADDLVEISRALRGSAPARESRLPTALPDR
ncbi:MAB_1171c family putative transporter [Streptomyces sp. CAU 1734]|uniref:MAB_1171c family putative transporter n=1 Tax=Streptomyces sp. CAU 1734 TaxID=3140360 RepID=UPI0032603F7D